MLSAADDVCSGVTRGLSQRGQAWRGLSQEGQAWRGVH